MAIITRLRASGALAGWSAGAAQDALASTYVELGDPLEAMSTYADALSTAVVIDHRRGQASVLQGMGRASTWRSRSVSR